MYQHIIQHKTNEINVLRFFLHFIRFIVLVYLEE